MCAVAYATMASAPSQRPCGEHTRTKTMSCFTPLNLQSAVVLLTTPARLLFLLYSPTPCRTCHTDTLRKQLQIIAIALVIVTRGAHSTWLHHTSHSCPNSPRKLQCAAPSSQLAALRQKDFPMKMKPMSCTIIKAITRPPRTTLIRVAKSQYSNLRHLHLLELIIHPPPAAKKPPPQLALSARKRSTGAAPASPSRVAHEEGDSRSRSHVARPTRQGQGAFHHTLIILG